MKSDAELTVSKNCRAMQLRYTRKVVSALCLMGREKKENKE